MDFNFTDKCSDHSSNFAKYFSLLFGGKETVLSCRDQLNPMYLKELAKGVCLSGAQGHPRCLAVAQMRDSS